jgi:dimethylaniline monooxygenase (N-oxide forming)
MYDVCIIGAGQSGITTIKTFSDQNIICLEKTDSNGMFQNIKEKNYFEWSSSKYMSAFSDFPMSKEMPIWFTIQDYIDYLKSYMTHFDLEKFIKYNSTVINCKELQNKDGWSVKYKDSNKIDHDLKCKKLIICTGLNQTVKYPDIISGFKGQILHTQDIYYMYEYEWFNTFTNKKVFLIGGGESAFDIGHLILNYTNELYYTTKEYIEWFPKGAESKENMQRMQKINNKCLNNIKNINETATYPTDTYLIYAEYNLPEILSYIWHEYGRYNTNTIDYCNKCTHQHHELCKINKTPNNLFLKYVTKRTNFLLDIYENKVQIVYYPTKIENKTITTKELNFEVDLIICSTGYKKYFPFLDENIYNGEFIKKIIPKNANNIAFIGFARPTMGSIATIAEVQSWWVKSYFEGMKYKIRKPFFRYYDVLDLSNNNINSLINGCYYIKDLAKDIKIEPNMFYLFFTDFLLFKNLYFSSCYNMIYRIHGQKSYIGSRQLFLDNVPDNKFEKFYDYKLLFMYTHIIYIIFIILLYWICYFITKNKIIPYFLFIFIIYLSYW